MTKPEQKCWATNLPKRPAQVSDWRIYLKIQRKYRQSAPQRAG
jgi:hypothetical protein